MYLCNSCGMYIRWIMIADIVQNITESVSDVRKIFESCQEKIIFR